MSFSILGRHQRYRRARSVTTVPASKAGRSSVPIRPLEHAVGPRADGEGKSPPRHSRPADAGNRGNQARLRRQHDGQPERTNALRQRAHRPKPNGTGQSRLGNSGAIPELLRLLWVLNHATLARSKWMEQALGVTGPQRLVVRLLGAKPGLAAGELAEVLSFDPSTLTGILSRLMTAGLITREVDPLDRRRSVFQLTSKGHKADQHLEGTIEDAVRRALRRLRKQDVDATERVIEALVTELEPAD